MRRTLMAVLMALAVSVGLVAASTGTAEAKTRKQVGYTQVVVAPAVYDLVTGAGISPAPLDGAKAYPYKGTLAANFPITGYSLGSLRIKHSGGISLTAGAATIELRNFYIDLGRGRVSGVVNGTVGNVGRVDLFKIRFTDNARPRPGQAHLDRHGGRCAQRHLRGQRLRGERDLRLRDAEAVLPLLGRE